MPRVPIDYSNTIIYKLCCKDININEIYIGHTTNLIERKRRHKTACNNPNDKAYNYYVYNFIRKNGGWENFHIIEIEKIHCSNKQEAEKKERYWIETLKSSLNKVVPGRNIQEYNNDNKEYIKERAKICRNKNIENKKKTNKIYYENNKKDILNYQKKYYEVNKEKIAQYHQKYYEVNAEKIREYHQQYYKIKKCQDFIK